MREIVIFGVGGFGRETAFLIEDINLLKPQWKLLGFLDEDSGKQGSRVNGYPVLGGIDRFLHNPEVFVVCAIGSPLARKKIVGILEQANARFPNIIHPHVICYHGNSFGVGNIVSSGNILNVDVTVGNHVCFEMASTIGHDVVIEDFVSLMPGVNVSGNVVLEEGCYLGTGCKIIQGKRIGKWAIVGAGAVVIHDVPPYSTVAGVPATVIKTRQAAAIEVNIEENSESRSMVVGELLLEKAKEKHRSW
ncbi:MAG: acetyltransferase [bacterium]